MKIGENDNVSSALSGNGDGKWAYNTLDAIGVGVKNFVSGEGVRELVKGAGDLLKKGWGFLKNWWKDDPVGVLATGGLITLGAVLVVGGGAAIGAIGGGIAALVGAGVAALGITSLVAPDLIRQGISWLIGKAYQIYSFNWNQTDAQIDAEAQILRQMLANVAGESLGEALGNIVCGWLPAQGLVKLNPTMFAKLQLALNVDNEWLDNVRDAFTSFMAVATEVGLNIAAQKLYKNIRRWIKVNANGLPIPSGMKEAISKWGEEGTQPWSFAIAIERKIESIQNEELKQFAEGLLEGLIDGCLEGAIVLNYAW